MSEIEQSWFHCGRCGSLFLATPGAQEDRHCTSCGCHPSLGTEQPAAIPPPRPRDDAEESRADSRQKRPQRKSKRRYLGVKLAVAWLLVLAAIIFGSRLLWKAPPAAGADFVNPNAPAPVPEEDLTLLDSGAAKCLSLFASFLSATSPEERNQFVLDPVATAARMARFYSLNPAPAIDPATARATGRAVIHFPGDRGIEAQFRTDDGNLVDAAFRQENGEWRLDWDHYARYSDYPWALFLAGSGEDEGEFRLLARERLADERKAGEPISLVLYAPRPGSAKDVGFQSPEFRIDHASPDGELLDAAFRQEREDRRPFDVRLPSIDPDGMIRVRVKVRRVEEDGRRRYEIVRVLACHWYAEDAPGVDPAAQPAAD